MSAEAQLEALLEIINSSARQAIAEYKKGGNGVPTIHSKTFHSVDFATDTLALKKAVRLLEGACQQLCASLAPPQHTVINIAQSYDWACMGVVLRTGVADALEKYPKGLHVNELSRIVGLEKGKLARVLRVLASKGCFTEVDTEIFANNRLSLITLATSDSGALARVHTQDISHGAAVLYESMTEPEYATSYELDKAPLSYALKMKGHSGNLFDLLNEDVGRRTNFHRAMIGGGHIMGSLSVLHHYPWNEVKAVCDVGASIGTFSIPLAKAYPHLKIINQDLPEAAFYAFREDVFLPSLSREQAQIHMLYDRMQVWAQDAPEALENNQVDFVTLNFFEESPVKGLDVYYLRNIIHDWPDAEATTILRNVRTAMGPDSRLLIHEYIMTTAKQPANYVGAEAAPEPMLPNFGAGNSRMYQQDLTMWFLHNAKERLLDEWITLGSIAGLRLEKVYDLAEAAVLDFRVAA
ncbi:O-methyltransferase-domain-containing protein [Melanogaster broomeanus]|nr:O-methyltransferase-domain-containing protein [Melanogaster broomeanus]